MVCKVTEPVKMKNVTFVNSPNMNELNFEESMEHQTNFGMEVSKAIGLKVVKVYLRSKVISGPSP